MDNHSLLIIDYCKKIAKIYNLKANYFIFLGCFKILRLVLWRKFLNFEYSYPHYLDKFFFFEILFKRSYAKLSIF